MSPTKRPGVEARACDARARLDALLAQVETRGISITITRRGRPVARLIPVTSGPVPDPTRLFREFMDFQAAHPFDGVTAKQLIGRRRTSKR